MRIEETAREAARLGADPVRGLDPSAVEASRQAHGRNVVPPPPRRSIASMLLEALSDKTLIILMGAAALALGVEALNGWLNPDHVPHWIDGLAILAAVVVATAVTTINDAAAQKEFRSLAAEREDIPVKVRRGEVTEISIREVVVGDLVIFGAGDRIPADGALLEGVDVHVDQSMLTGESIPVEKGPDDVVLSSGVIVTEGTGTMLVTAVGEATEMGKLQLALTSDEDGPTPLQERLSKLADQIGLIGLGAAILTFLALLGSGVARDTLPLEWSFGTAEQLLEFLIVAVTIIVVAVPEGLPVAVTISLAYSVRKMAKDKNLVRRLASCETMGAATVICSDKTGTLTENQMSVAELWVEGALGEAEQRILAEIVALDSTAFLEHVDGRRRFVGNPTECALLAYVEDRGGDYRAIRAAAEVAHQYGFTSDRKRMSTLLASGRLLVKGAPEVVLGLCDRIHRDGPIPLDEATRARVLEKMRAMSSLGHRTLGLAYRDGAPEGAEEAERSLVFFALAGIADPLRPEVKGAIERARGAGVEVKMVTGDNRVIAETIARQLDLLGDGLVMEGPEFRALGDAEAKEAAGKLRVLARSVPTDKHRLVTLLEERGEVVAVTGDGTNDAPALKAADVGFAMGRAGTEVAKEASDIVLVDDNFASIVLAIRWGRSIFENVRKFLQFQLTVNAVALITAFLAAVMGFGIPLNAVQLLWVNLIMDTLAALALAVEPPTDALLEQPPHGRREPLITKSMWTSIIATGVVMVTLLVGIMQGSWFVPEGTDRETHASFVFNAFVWMHIFNEVNARSTRFNRGVFAGLLESRLFLGVIGVTAVAQVIIVELGGEFFRTVPLSAELWVASILVGASMLPLGIALRAAGRRFAA